MGLFIHMVKMVPQSLRTGLAKLRFTGSNLLCHQQEVGWLMIQIVIFSDVWKCDRAVNLFETMLEPVTTLHFAPVHADRKPKLRAPVEFNRGFVAASGCLKATKTSTLAGAG